MLTDEMQKSKHFVRKRLMKRETKQAERSTKAQVFQLARVLIISGLGMV